MNERKRKRYSALILALMLLLSGCGAAVAAPQQVQSAAAPVAPLPTAEPTEAPTPEPTPVPTPEPTEAPADVPFSPDLTEQPRAEDAFFADSAFFGNSLVQGFGKFGGIETADYFAETSASVVNVSLTQNTKLQSGKHGTLLQALGEGDYARVYLLLGINEISFGVNYFIELYGAVVEEIRAAQPEAEIYIMSLTPVTQQKSKANKYFTRDRIACYNAALYDYAAENGCYYLDLVAALGDEDGFLPAEDSTDGIHMQPEKYAAWGEYLRTHYAAPAV